MDAIDEMRAFGAEGDWAMARRHRVRWIECDMNAHVNNAAYLTWCEDLRTSHWREIGGGFGGGAPVPVVARIEARYLKPLHYDDAVLITFRPTAVRRTSCTHEYAVWKQGAVFTCTTLVVVVAGDEGLPVPIPPAIRARLVGQGAKQGAKQASPGA